MHVESLYQVRAPAQQQTPIILQGMQHKVRAGSGQQDVRVHSADEERSLYGLWPAFSSGMYGLRSLGQHDQVQSCMSDANGLTIAPEIGDSEVRAGLQQLSQIAQLSATEWTNGVSYDSINIIGDIAGRYDELMELLAKMPAASLTLAVGDLVDRGPKSRQVVEWFMGDPMSRESLQANHEQMMLAACELWPHQPLLHPYWPRNGGTQTIESYGLSPPPAEHLRWLAYRPAWFKQDGLFVSHAPVYDVYDIPPQYGYDWRAEARRADYGDETGWCWNRQLSARPMPGHYMVYGHNSFSFGPSVHVDEDGKMTEYAFCIDNSRQRSLTGMHWPTKELFSVDYSR